MMTDTDTGVPSGAVGDAAPVPAARVDAVAEIVREVFAAAGGERIDPPIIQPARPYIDLSGEDVRARLFLVEDPEGRQLCLRPDMTIPACRHHLAMADDPALPADYRVDGKVFRYAPPRSNRPAEFIQIGLERFSASDPLAADIGVCAVALEAVARGGGHVGRLMFGDAGLFPLVMQELGVSADMARRLTQGTRAAGKSSALAQPVSGPSKLAEALGALPEGEAAAALEEVFTLAGIAPVGGRTPAAIAQRLIEQAAQPGSGALDEAVVFAERLSAIEAAPRPALDALAALFSEMGVGIDDRLEAWAKRIDGLEAAGVDLSPAVLSIKFARQFDYYDGFVFEAQDLRLGPALVMAAGGRYDGLAQRLGSPAPLPGVGSMARPGRIARSADLP